MSPATYGPRSGGPGYLIAPLKGRDAALFEQVFLEGERKSVPSREVQTLIWAIASQNFDYVLKHPRATQLLKPEQLVALRARIEQRKRTGSLLTLLESNLPPEVRELVNLQQKFLDQFNAFTRGAVSFEDLEKAAVLTGDPPPAKGDRSIPPGQWVRVPEGYYVRYLPSSYSGARVEFYRPEPIRNVNDELGRPRSVINAANGLRIEYEYYGDSVFVPHPKYPEIKAYPFKSVTITFPAPLTPDGREQVLSVKNTGYILVGPLDAIRRKPQGTDRRPPRTVLMASLSPEIPSFREDAPAGPTQLSFLSKPGDDAAQDVAKDTLVNTLSQTSVGDIADKADKFNTWMKAGQAAMELQNPNTSMADKQRASVDILDAIASPVSAAFSIPYALAKVLVATVTGLYDQVASVMSGGGDKDPVAGGHVGVGVPGQSGRQRSGPASY